MRREGKKERKERSDKKIDVKPTIPIVLHNSISDLSYCIDTPVKDVVERICMEGIDTHRVIEYISPMFKRRYEGLPNNPFYGNSELSHSRSILRDGVRTKRISTRFSKEFYERIKELSASLDLTPSSTTGLLLEASIKDINIIDRIIKPYTSNMDEHQKRAMKEVIKYIKRNNPFFSQASFKEVIEYLWEWLKDN